MSGGENLDYSLLKKSAMRRLISFSRLQISADFFDEYSQSCLAYRKRRTRLSEINPEFLVVENRIRTLEISIWRETTPVPVNDYSYYMAFDKTLKILESLQGKLNGLKSFYSRFSKSCSGADVARIMACIPATVHYVNVLDPVSPEQFFALANGLHSSCKIVMGNVVYWYRNCPAASDSAALPPTFEEYVFNLLEPLAIAGKTFESPFINFGDEVDLEHVYARLRVIAAMPFAGLDDDELRTEA
jgi:hypothetical protein